MSYDYRPKVKSAQEKVAKYGRPISLLLLGNEPEDPDKPWKQGAQKIIDTVVTKGVFVPAGNDSSSDTMWGLSIIGEELLRTVNQVMIVAVTEGKDLEKYQAVIDTNDSKQYGLPFCRTLRPGDTTILYFFGVGSK